MPVRRVGENVPLVTSPTRGAVGVEHRHARARDAAAGRRAAPTAAAAGPASFSASSASRPQNAGFFQPTAQPGPGLHRA